MPELTKELANKLMDEAEAVMMAELGVTRDEFDALKEDAISGGDDTWNKLKTLKVYNGFEGDDCPCPMCNARRAYEKAHPTDRQDGPAAMRLPSKAQVYEEVDAESPLLELIQKALGGKDANDALQKALDGARDELRKEVGDFGAHAKKVSDNVEAALLASKGTPFEEATEEALKAWRGFIDEAEVNAVPAWDHVKPMALAFAALTMDLSLHGVIAEEKGDKAVDIDACDKMASVVEALAKYPRKSVPMPEDDRNYDVMSLGLAINQGRFWEGAAKALASIK